jgi:hypothetical protein
MEAEASSPRNRPRRSRADSSSRRYGRTSKGTAQIVLALILLCGHSCILLYGACVAQNETLTLILAAGIVAIAVMLIVKAFRVETAKDRW